MPLECQTPEEKMEREREKAAVAVSCGNLHCLQLCATYEYEYCAHCFQWKWKTYTLGTSECPVPRPPNAVLCCAHFNCVSLLWAEKPKKKLNWKVKCLHLLLYLWKCSHCCIIPSPFIHSSFFHSLSLVLLCFIALQFIWCAASQITHTPRCWLRLYNCECASVRVCVWAHNGRQNPRKTLKVTATATKTYSFWDLRKVLVPPQGG